jgi:transcription initiation factor TFIIIB Brf1 subunit/transcription initiation factor TFIIB
MKINLGLIGMKCDECGSRDSSFDERMGERICNECGLVMVQEAFEETVRVTEDSSKDNWGNLGSDARVNVPGIRTQVVRNMTGLSSTETTITRGVAMTKMVFSSLHLGFDLSDRIFESYSELYRKNIFKSNKIEERATALVYYLLRENGTPVPMETVCSEFSVNKRVVNKLVRRIVRHYGRRPDLNYRVDYEMRRCAETLTKMPEFPHLCMETLNFLNKVCEAHKINISKAHPYAALCITSRMHNMGLTVEGVAEVAPINAVSISRAMQKMLSPLDVRYTDLKGKTIRDLEKLL